MLPRAGFVLTGSGPGRLMPSTVGLAARGAAAAVVTGLEGRFQSVDVDQMNRVRRQINTVANPPPAPIAGDSDGPKIKSVRAYVLGVSGGADYHNHDDWHWIVDTPISNPMSGYAKYSGSRASWGIDALGTVVAEVELEDGTVGVGPSIGGNPACHIIEHHLSRFVEGQDVRNTNLMWDQMYRATMPYGRKGLPLHAISAVDLAIWDALGKWRREPVYAMIGGLVRDRLPVYATTADPVKAHALGFKGAKIPLPYGPADGKAGMDKNIETVARWRAALPDDFPLMIDCYMSLTVPYTIELARRLADIDVNWIEEMLHPDDYDGYAELRRQITSTKLTAGEHEYSRYGMRKLLQDRSVDILQPDVTWVGGLTECLRIVAMAAAYDVPVIPHGSSVYSYQMQVASPNCPLAEMILMAPRADAITPSFGALFTDEPLPVDGFITLDPSRHGFGVTLNRDELGLVRPYARD